MDGGKSYEHPHKYTFHGASYAASESFPACCYAISKSPKFQNLYYSIMYRPTHIACRGLLRRCDIRRRA